jgi:Glycosyltransferase family 87
MIKGFLLSKERLFGAILVGVGIVCNEWVLTKAFSADGVVEDITLRGSIWVFDIACVVLGSFLLLRGAGAPDVVYRHGRWALVIVCGLLLALWVETVAQIYDGRGLFRWLGGDYGLYLAQANALRSDDPTNVYDLDALQGEYQELLDRYPHVSSGKIKATHVPYPPLFAWLFGLFTVPEPHIGFIMWTVVNALAALYLAWRAASFFQKADRPFVALLILSSYPVMCSLIMGQPQILLACAVAEFYLALRAGRDLRAGLYLSLLLFKPQYGVLLGPLLMWKRRWGAVAGAIIGAVIIVGGSIVVAGIPTLLEYPAALTEMAEFRGDHRRMINWRSLILWLWPQVSDQSGMMLELFLSGVTVLVTALAWRGPWEPHQPRFAIQMSLTLLATLLANHHSFQHGAVLLAVPLASAMAHADPSRFTQLIVIAGSLLPTLSFTAVFSLDAPQASWLLTVFLSTCYASLLMVLWIRGRSIQEVWTRFHIQRQG